MTKFEFFLGFDDLPKLEEGEKVYDVVMDGSNIEVRYLKVFNNGKTRQRFFVFGLNHLRCGDIAKTTPQLLFSWTQVFEPYEVAG